MSNGRLVRNGFKVEELLQSRSTRTQKIVPEQVGRISKIMPMSLVGAHYLLSVTESQAAG
jgi:hypothetical protein